MSRAVWPFQLTVLRVYLFFAAMIATQSVLAIAVGNMYLDSALSTHVMNMTLNAGVNGWPQSTEGLATLTPTVTATICGQLPSTVNACEAFLMTVSAATGVLGLQVSVQTATASDAAVSYRRLMDWSNNVNPPLATLKSSCEQALQAGVLDPLTFRSGQYLMPCRNSEVYQFLPVCQPGEIPVTVVYIGNATGSTNLESYFRGKVCGDVADCSAVQITVSQLPMQSDYTVVNITGAGSGLEAVLSYVADVRAAFLQSHSTVYGTSVVGPGNAAAGVSATVVQMRYNGMEATLFSTIENERFEEKYPMVVECPTTTGLWALALLALLPILMFTFCYVRYRGRRRSKKHQRKLIIEDELRIMQGYTSPGGAAADGDGGNGANPADGAGGAYMADNGMGYYGADGAMDPPPGMDYQGMASQDGQTANGGGTVWMMDADGNYYEVPADQYQNQENADPANSAQGAQAALTDLTTAQQEDNGQADVDAGQTYQTYVDPNTGEVYQYETSPGDANQGVDGGGALDETNNEQYETYIDPTTGEAYQYDPNAAADGGDQEGAQSYVDPNNEEAYQVDADAAAAADGGAAEGVQVYVDPNTGETYQYDPATGQSYLYDPNAAAE